MADIAHDVGIGASAMYRHFDTKQDVLHAVVAAALGSVRDAIDGISDLDDQLSALVGVVARSRGPWTLWEREAVHLTDRARRASAGAIRHIHAHLVDAMVEDDSSMPRDEAVLKAWAALAVVRVGTHPRGQPVPGAHELLVAAAWSVCRAPLPEVAVPQTSRRPSNPLPAPTARREAILGAASRLFGKRGYRSVTLDDIGRAAGIAGPSIYYHFPSKADLLQRVVHRFNEVLWMGVHRAVNTNEAAEAALRALLGRYIDFALDSPELVGTVVAELVHLPPQTRDRFRRIQDAYIDEWVHLQRLARDPLDESHALVLVLATLSVINTLARTPELRSRPSLASDLAELGGAVLTTASPQTLAPAPRPHDEVDHVPAEGPTAAPSPDDA